MRRILLIASLVPLFLTCIPARAQNQSKFAAEFSDHRILLPYSHAIPHPNETVGPNGDPKTDSHDKTEKAYSFSRDVEGSFELRFFLSESIAPAGHVVPFYFQPTMGGSDLNGDRALSSYQDYRFRAPNVMFARAAFEHSLWKLPLGFTAMADYGKSRSLAVISTSTTCATAFRQVSRSAGKISLSSGFCSRGAGMRALTPLAM